MTLKQQKKFRKELKDYLDFEYDDLNTINRLIEASKQANQDISNSLFCYAMGIATPQTDPICDFLNVETIDQDLVLKLKGQVCLKWVVDFLENPNQKYKVALEKAAKTK